MNWHKLQHKLFELDLVDPKEDLAKLQGNLGNIDQPVNESVDYVYETHEVLEGSMPTDRDYSLSDFAALAGIKLTEGKQKEGRPGQAKHSDPKPKKLPAGSTKNVSKDKLVGDSIDNNLEEGPLGDIGNSFKSGFAKGREKGMATDYVQNKVQSALNPNGSPAPKRPKQSKVNPQRLSRLIPVENPQYLISGLRKQQQGQPLARPEIETLADAFTKLIDMDPRQTSRVMQTLKQMQIPQDPKEESIKERLYRELRKKGL